jgi:hypothetical protein
VGGRETGIGTVAAQDAMQDEMMTIGRRAGTEIFSTTDEVVVLEGETVAIAMGSVEVEEDKSARRAPPRHQRRGSQLRI